MELQPQVTAYNLCISHAILSKCGFSKSNQGCGLTSRDLKHHFAEQLINISDELEETLTQYEGDNQEQMQKVVYARGSIEKAITNPKPTGYGK